MRAKEKLAALRGLVDNAVLNGSLSRDLADAFYDVAGRDGAVTGTAAPVRSVSVPLTVSLEVTGGDVSQATGQRAAREVERALAGVARQAGLSIVPGSVAVRRS